MHKLKPGDVVVVRDSRGSEDQEHQKLLRWFGTHERTVLEVRETKVCFQGKGDDDWWLADHFKKC